MDFTYFPTQTYIYIETQGADYKISTAFITFELTSSNLSISGMATVGKSYFGIETIPIFSFGKTNETSRDFGKSKKQACSDFGHSISQKTVLAGVSEGTREFLEKLDENLWTPVSFNPSKREVCIQIDTNSGMNTITVELLVP